MIEVSVGTGDLVAQRRSPLSIRFTNTGRGPCTNIVFRLVLPPGVVLMGGSDRADIPVIPAGRTHTHEVMVVAGRPGMFELKSSNFSYRDEDDMPVRVNDFHARLRVAAASAAVVRQTIGSLSVACENGELALGDWGELRILVTNRTGVPLNDVTMTVEGPIHGDGKRSRVEVLADGATARFSLHVKATEGGSHVPVTVRTAYKHIDHTGAVWPRTQENVVHVVVRQSAPDKQPPPVDQTVLYLTASPRNLPHLRSDLEMRKVKERLQLSRDRDRYRIESAVAVRFDDISQALIDHEPQVIHFSGHGGRDGSLCIEDENGDTDLITPQGLATLFGQHKSTVRCVVLNACYSVRLAEALASQIDYVIGMRYQIGDEAAIVFSVGFYLALFGGRSIPEAFERGRAHIEARPALVREHLTPLLFPPGL